MYRYVGRYEYVKGVKHMKNYLYLYPESKIRKISTKTSETFSLISPTLEHKRFELNETAVEIISLFNGLKTYDEIIQNLAFKYSEAFQQIEKKFSCF